MDRRAFLRASSTAGGLLAGSPFASTPAVSARRQDGDDADGGIDEADFFREASVGSLAPIGRVDAPGAAEAVVGDDGETVFLATYDGITSVDVSDPANPTILAERRPLLEDAVEGSFTEVLDVSVDGDRLVAVGPANPAPESAFHGLAVYDVSDPTDPVRVGDPFETGVHIHNCYLAGEHCYLVVNPAGDGVAVENGLVICDVSGEEVEEVGRWSLTERDERWADVHFLLWYLHDVFVRGDVAYLSHWNAGTVLLDVSDPADPTFLSRISSVSVEDQLAVEAGAVTEAQRTLPGNDHYAAVDERGELLAVGRESWAAASGDPEGAGGIDLYDASDPTDPVHRSTIDAPATPDASYFGGTWTTSHNLELREGRLYSSWYLGGVAVHDVADPSSPAELGRWRNPEAAAFWTARVAADSFVASSTELVPNADVDGALYAFPLTDWERAAAAADAQTADAEAADGGSTSNESTHPSSSGESENDSAADDAGRSSPIPGFTALGGLGGLAGGAVALEARRRRAREGRARADDDGRVRADDCRDGR